MESRDRRKLKGQKKMFELHVNLSLGCTARSREDETRNGHWNAKRNPRWLSQVSSQMAHLKRDLNFDRGSSVIVKHLFVQMSSNI